VIELGEIHERFIDTVKADLKNQIIMEQNLDVEVMNLDSKDTVIKMNPLNSPSILFVWIRSCESITFNSETPDGMKLFEFNLSDLSDDKDALEGADSVYQLSSILSYNGSERSFEVINRRNETWKGLANGSEIDMSHPDLLNVVSAIIENPVMLVYQQSATIEKNKYMYEEGDVEMYFEDEEAKAQYEKDRKMAEDLQKDFDDKEDSIRWFSTSYTFTF
jgi:hypothetical protein